MMVWYVLFSSTVITDLLGESSRANFKTGWLVRVLLKSSEETQYRTVDRARTDTGQNITSEAAKTKDLARFSHFRSDVLFTEAAILIMAYLLIGRPHILSRPQFNIFIFSLCQARRAG
jgi:hypothetical protein